MSIIGQPTSPLPPQAVVAILRAPTTRHFIDASSVLWDAGIQCFEFTLTTEGALQAVSAFPELQPEAIVGAGTGFCKRGVPRYDDHRYHPGSASGR
ncbi:MAG TPA: hypothetical protein VNT27_06365 [Propionibacteriaceae bacterium]|jgi:2-keto-3-deoxy-6-phosphogluconate aldolase|nr:hypothetical protein [Propionibacteriaceae bacterium]